MTQESRIDRLEGIVERLAVEQAENRQDMRDMRREMDSRFRTLLLVNIALWVTSIGSIIGLFFRGARLC